MDFRNLVIDCNATFGEVRFKKIINKTFKYVNNEKTDQFIGYKVLFESTEKRDVFEVKIMDDNIENYTNLAIKQKEIYNYSVVFDELFFNVNLFKGNLYHNLTSDSFKVIQND